MRTLSVLWIATTLSIPAIGVAQAPSFGLKGGLNVADFGGRRIVESDYRVGFTGGAFVAIPISATVSIQPEVSFSQRGARRAAYDYSDIPADGDAPPVGVYVSEKTSLDYVEVPVLLKLSPSLASSFVRPIFFAGPSVGFLVSAKKIYGTDYSDYLNSADFGLIIGGGVELGRLSLDVRYNLGLSTIDKKYDGTFGNVPGGVKNRSFTMTTGIRLF